MSGYRSEAEMARSMDIGVFASLHVVLVRR
jgi:hypothetical protein